MRVEKHKLPKQVAKHAQTAKHKHSEKHIKVHAEKAAKKEKQNSEMQVDASTNNNTAAEKLTKQKDRSRTDYKRISKDITDRRGPRAV